MEKRTVSLWIAIGITALMATGCGGKAPEASGVGIISEDGETHSYDEEDMDDVKIIKAAYHDICDKAKDTSDSQEVIRSIVERLGESGYAAVDSENQIDMVCPERIRQFCRQVEAKESAEELLIVVDSKDSFIRYEFAAEDGNVEVRRSYFLYNDGWEMASTKKYPAYTWVYSGGRYLFFEEYHKPGFDGPSGHTAIRIEPLDESYRELNRKYLRVIGYEQNNLFTSDWSEDDFGELHFYDLYEVLYRMKNGQYEGSFFEEGVNYEIPASIFENVFHSFFRIDEQVLRQHTTYHEDTETYRYRARGMFDIAPTPYIPYPEVVSCEEKQDGTIKLVVNAVWAEKNMERAFCHEVTIRPLEGEGFQYVSNHVIPSEDNVEVTWYTERLADDDWQEYYAERGFTEEAEPAGILSPEEERGLQDAAISAAEYCMKYYRDAGVAGRETSVSGIRDFSEKQREDMVKCLGKQGFVSVSDGINMENHPKMEEFYSAYTSGKEAMVTVFDVHREGDICARTFIHRNGKIQSYYVSVGWREEDIPEIKEFGSNDLEEIRLTEKGYFIYTNKKTVMHGNLREYYRVKPLSDKCRELTKKYIYGLSYVNYNMLVTDWDADNVEDILMPCMFEDIYRICEGESPSAENGMIPAEIYERIITTYFPVSAEQLREHCGYHADTDSYEYEMICSKQFPPFGEVVDYRQNGDGTITLFVDGVWIDYDSDRAYTNRIVVRPFADGTFRYLFNEVEQKVFPE